jgi:hypothetical protein
MKLFGAIGMMGLAAITAAACGSSQNDPPRTPAEAQAMNELTPSEKKEAERRAANEHAREKEQLAASRDDQSRSNGQPKAGRTTTALAISSVATARCDRELRCKNIGVNQKYLSTDECITKLQNDKRVDINPQECPGGVNEKELASCLKSIRDEDCGNPLDAIGRLSACRAGALCVDTK